jgi:cellulose biosynthesis protein BcsQ
MTPRPARVIVIGNGKGGVLKTSGTSALAVLLAASGYQTLAIDLDPQGNLGHDLGFAGDDGLGLSTAAMSGECPPVLSDVRDRLDVIPGGPHLEGMAAGLQAMARAERGGTRALVASLRLAIDRGRYDFVVVDTPPGGSFLQQAALELGTWLLIPAKSDRSSREGLQDMAARFVAARQTNPALALLGVVLVGVNRSAKRTVADAREALEADLSGLPPETLFEATIRHVEAAAVAAREQGRTPHELAEEILPVGQRIAASRAGLRVVGESMAGLAQDQEDVAGEVLQRIAAAEGHAPVAAVSEVTA